MPDTIEVGVPQVTPEVFAAQAFCAPEGRLKGSVKWFDERKVMTAAEKQRASERGDERRLISPVYLDTMLRIVGLWLHRRGWRGDRGRPERERHLRPLQ
eukprot:scaffold2022_cov261-Pinguiococcus_pyrenoidosus.AAC.24